MSKSKAPSNVNENGWNNSGIHMCIFFDRLRIQVNGGEPFYTDDIVAILKIKEFAAYAAKEIQKTRREATETQTQPPSTKAEEK